MTTGTLPPRTKKKVRKALGMVNRLTLYVLLVDQEGKVRWQATGKGTPDEVESLIRCARQLVAEGGGGSSNSSGNNNDGEGGAEAGAGARGRGGQGKGSKKASSGDPRAARGNSHRQRGGRW